MRRIIQPQWLEAVHIEVATMLPQHAVSCKTNSAPKLGQRYQAWLTSTQTLALYLQLVQKR